MCGYNLEGLCMVNLTHGQCRVHTGINLASRSRRKVARAYCATKEAPVVDRLIKYLLSPLLYPLDKKMNSHASNHAALREGGGEVGTIARHGAQTKYSPSQRVFC